MPASSPTASTSAGSSWRPRSGWRSSPGPWRSSSRPTLIVFWQILVLAVLSGVANALASPAFQAIVPALVERAALGNAIALNSAQFNLARIVGPAVAGVLIGIAGEAASFWLNALSFIAVIIALVAIRMPTEAVDRALPGRPVGQPRRRPGLRPAAASPAGPAPPVDRAGRLHPALPRPPAALCRRPRDRGGRPRPAHRVDRRRGAHRRARRGLPAAGRGERADPRGRPCVHGPHRRDLRPVAQRGSLTCVALAGLGGAQVAYYTSTNTLIQLLSPGRLRGRIMSIYVLTSIGVSPIGSLLAGGVAQVIGAPATLAAGGALTVAALAIVVAWYPGAVAPPRRGDRDRERSTPAQGVIKPCGASANEPAFDTAGPRVAISPGGRPPARSVPSAPRPARPRAVAAVPYDVVSTDEARALAAGNPLSFLHVSRAEIDLPDEHRPPRRRGLRDGRRELRPAARATRRSSRTAPEPVRLPPADGRPRADRHRRLLLGRRIRAATSSASTSGRARTRKTTGPGTSSSFGPRPDPSSCVYQAAARDRPRLVARVAAAPPLFDFSAADGVRHTLWRLDPGSRRRPRRGAFAASPGPVHRRRPPPGGERDAGAPGASEPSSAAASPSEADTFLAVAFPDDQTPDPALPPVREGPRRPDARRRSSRRSAEQVEVRRPGTSDTAAGGGRTGEVCDVPAGAWYSAWRSPPAPAGTPPAEALDVARLQAQVLGPAARDRRPADRPADRLRRRDPRIRRPRERGRRGQARGGLRAPSGRASPT